MKGKLPMRAVLCLMSIVFFAGPAFASGGLSCKVEDKAVRLTIESGVTRGMGSPVFNFRGELEIVDAAVADDLRKTPFDAAHLAQYWLDGEELRMIVYRERESDKPHGYVEAVVKTKAGEEGNYDGVYSITVFDMTGATGGDGKTINIGGDISCFVE